MLMLVLVLALVPEPVLVLELVLVLVMVNRKKCGDMDAKASNMELNECQNRAPNFAKFILSGAKRGSRRSRNRKETASNKGAGGLRISCFVLNEKVANMAPTRLPKWNHTRSASSEPHRATRSASS